jgi:hypothetical protein
MVNLGDRVQSLAENANNAPNDINDFLVVSETPPHVLPFVSSSTFILDREGDAASHNKRARDAHEENSINDK